MVKESCILKITDGIFFVCSALFFALLYPGHIRFQEQYQLFEWTVEYFTSVSAVPGGFADWCGRCLTQFFISPTAGGCIIAVLTVLLLRLTRKLTTVTGPEGYILPLIPPFLLFSMFLSDSALTGAAVAILLPMEASLFFKNCPKGNARTAAIFICIPLLYFLCGPAAILSAVILPADEDARTKAAVPLLMLLCPAAAQFLFHYPPERLYYGIHYVRIPSEFPTDLWLTALSIITVYFIPVLLKSRKMVIVVSCTLAVMSLIRLFSPGPDMEKEKTMRCDASVMEEDWTSIIRDARKSMPDNALSVSCLNLALAETGMLPENQFSYFQAGEKGLFPSYSISFRSLPCISEIYWHLGMVNACQQYIFDAQESIPDFQKSGRCYKRLAETSLINGDYRVAEKYLEALKNTLFYHRWAQQTQMLIEEPAGIETHPIYGHQRSLRPDDTVFLFNENNKYAMCLNLLEHNPDNIMAGQYLYSLLLLEKDLEGFRKVFRTDHYQTMPKHYQEALLLLCINDRKPLDSLTDMVSEKNMVRMKSFIYDMKSNTPEGTMQKKYGDTYWYYAIYK